MEAANDPLRAFETSPTLDPREGTMTPVTVVVEVEGRE